MGNVIFGVTDPVWIVYAGIIPFLLISAKLLFYWILSGCGHELYGVEGVLCYLYSPVGGSLIPLLQSRVLRLGWYILPLWIVNGIGRFITSADVIHFLVWGRLYLERLCPSEMVGQAIECSRPHDPAYSHTSCHPGIILVDIGLVGSGVCAPY